MRLLHTMLRVSDLEKSIHFYTDVLGMKLLRKKEYPHGRFTLAFVGYGDEMKESVLELTHNWDTNEYSLGNAYGHIAIQCDDLIGTCDRIVEMGGEIVSKPHRMTDGPVLAFARDPDGYAIELLGPDCFENR